MQSDEKLDKTYSNTIAWDKNPLSGRDKQFVNRFTLPTLERGKLSFSGNERNHLFQNMDGQKFKDISGISGVDSIQDGRCFAVLDYDRDGWQDIALVNINTPVLSLFRNQQGQTARPSKHKMLGVRLVGGNQTDQRSSQYSSRNGIGARVTVKLANQTFVQQLNCGEGLAAQNSSTLLFGLGPNTEVDSIEVRWPSGIKQAFKDFKAGDLVTVFENQAEAPKGAGFAIENYHVGPHVATSSTAKVESHKMPIEQNASPPKITVFISMATWCPNCKNEIPQLNLLRSKFSTEDLEIVAVPIDPSESEDVLQSYRDKFKTPYTLRKVKGQRERFSLIVSETLGLDVLPTYVIVDRSGQVRSVRAGTPTVSDLKRALNQ